MHSVAISYAERNWRSVCQSKLLKNLGLCDPDIDFFILFYLASRQVGGEKIIMNNPEAVYDQSASSAEPSEKNSMLHTLKVSKILDPMLSNQLRVPKCKSPRLRGRGALSCSTAFTTKTAAKTFWHK